jgi:predicted phosphohydrolase
MPKDAAVRIVMTHFPPISLDGRTSRAVRASRVTDATYGSSATALGGPALGGFDRTIGSTVRDLLRGLPGLLSQAVYDDSAP